MKKIILTLTAIAVTVSGTQQAAAGDKEWATAGKVLTGVVAATVLAKTVHHHNPRVQTPVYTQTTTTYSSPAYRHTTPVIVQQPVVYRTAPVVVQQRVVYQPAPVVVHRPVVYYPAPVVVHHAPVVCSTPVVVRHTPAYVPRSSGFSFSIGFGGGGHHRGHHGNGHYGGHGHGRGHSSHFR